MKWNGVREECQDWRSITYGELLGELVKKYGDRIAVIGEEEQITYRELDKLSDNLLGYFLENDLSCGDIVIL